MMTPEQEKAWKDACIKAERAKGYVPSELLMIPILADLAKKRLIDIGIFDDLTVIGTKGSLDKKESDNTCPECELDHPVHTTNDLSDGNWHEVKDDSTTIIPDPFKKENKK